MTSSSNQAGFARSDQRNNLLSSSGFMMPNPRMDSLPQQPSNTAAFDASTPGSIDFTFPFAGSPHGSSNSGIDAPPDLRLSQSQGFAGRGSVAAYGRVPSPQHRASLASIDSAFDRDLFGSAALSQWAPTNSGNQAPSNADSSPRIPASVGDQEKKSQTEEERPPAWSELKTKAGKERKRLPLACIACRRKKIRCSGEKPACKHCLRARIPCVYKVTTRKAAPRTDYMAMLDKRLKRMEDRVIRVIPKDELPDLSSTGRASVRPPIPGQAPKKEKEQPKKRSADEAFTQELSDWRNSREKTTLLDPTAGLRKQREGENKLFIEGSESLPPQHIQEHLAEVFFDCVYGQSYLLLHKPSFMRKLKAGTIPPVLILAVCAISARFSTHPQVSTEPAFLRGEQWATPARRIVEKRHYEPNITILTAMLMLGLHYFGTCEGGLSWSFGGQAMRMGYALQLHRELDHDPLGRNQIANNANESKKGPKPPELSFTDREIRRRTMWACYLMDTFNSSGTERPSFLNEDYYQIQLPIKESHFQMEVPGPTEDLYGNVPMSNKSSALDTAAANELAAEAKANMGVAAYIVRAVVLWKRIVKYLNLGGKDKDPHPIWDPLSQFATLQRQINQLKSSLPEEITYTPENFATHVSERLANQYLFLHIVLAQTSLFLHRFAIPTNPSHRPHHHYYTQQGMPKPFLTSSANIVLESASLISKLIADSTGHTLTVPFAGYCAYAAATVHVWGIFSKNSALEQQSKDNLRHNYKYLTRMKRYWGMFHYMAESVKDIYRAFADAALRQAQHARNSAGLPTSMLRRHSSAGGAGGRSGTQTPMDMDATATLTSNTNPPSRSDTPADPTKSKDADKAKAGSMFQYGDWFDKYPHGVSESEWEKSHLEYRSEHAQGGAEAVMSQRSDLQSVEEFFASLSPPSKADDTIGRGNKKVARRRGKSVAENKKADKDEKTKEGDKGKGTPSTAAKGAGPSISGQDSQRRQSMSQTLPDQRLSGTAGDLNLSINLNQPFDLSSFDITSPSLYQNTQFADPYNYGNSPTSPQFGGNLHFLSTLPAIDRQMVYGAAYGGLDPSTSNNNGGQNASSGLNNLGSPPIGNFGSTNPWDQLDLTTYGLNDPFAGGHGTMDTSSSAWLLPFNIEPPSFGGSGMEEFGNTALDGMDLSDLGQGGGSDVGGQFGDQNSGTGGQT
ncbi:putative C6 transcription factor [Cladophialophora carrionii]|uniref:Putative C6 transcription factor n=1 Tax=Cladophialophora carrionii TaxID=86049 RepID=A0A1C1CXC8_9EURO|nr:putative C6 transcription factor [Cladophialophora carrionii]